MLIHNADITGSLTINGIPFNTGSFSGSFTGAVAGTTSTASYVEYNNVANKPALVSGSSQITYSGLTGIPSGIVSGSSQVTYSGLTGIPSGIVSGSSQVTYSGLTGIPSGIVSGSAQVAGFGIFATTGSNQFNGSQAITGSLTTTGTIIAQTLNVQQVTSSIMYSSGSNIFGNSLANTQQFTGSLQVSGSTHYLLGNVGIGISSPGYDGAGYGAIRYVTINNASNTGTSLELANGTTANDGFISSVDFINTTNSGSAGPGRYGIASIRAYTTNVGATNTGGGYLTFNTKADGGNGAERMLITSTGVACFACQVCSSGFYTTGNSCLGAKVAINSIIDSEAVLRVGVIGNTTDTITCSTGLRLFTSNNTAGQGVSLAFTAGSTKETGIILAAENTSGQNGDFVIRTYAGGANYPERMRIASTGVACFACELTAKSLGTNDLILNNLNHEHANYVDGTRGSWLIQEGACDLFIINQVSCKKYKFNLIEIK